jgi:hypothetical protein
MRMKRLIAMGSMVALAALGIRPSAAEALDATYISGTSPGMANGVVGAVDTTAEKQLRFRAGGTELAIPYAEMTTIDYREMNRFQLGVVPAIVVGALKARSKFHVVAISWTNQAGVVNVAALEMGRTKAMVLLTVLRAKAPFVCGSGCRWPR